MKPYGWLHATQIGGVHGAPARAELHQRVALVGHGGVGAQQQEHCRWRAATATCDGDVGVVGDDEFSPAGRWNLFHDRPHQALHLLMLPAQRKHEHLATPHVRQDRKAFV